MFRAFITLKIIWLKAGMKIIEFHSKEVFMLNMGIKHRFYPQ